MSCQCYRRGQSVVHQNDDQCHVSVTEDMLVHQNDQQCHVSITEDMLVHQNDHQCIVSITEDMLVHQSDHQCHVSVTEDMLVHHNDQQCRVNFTASPRLRAGGLQLQAGQGQQLPGEDKAHHGVSRHQRHHGRSTRGGWGQVCVSIGETNV